MKSYDMYKWSEAEVAGIIKDNGAAAAFVIASAQNAIIDKVVASERDRIMGEFTLTADMAAKMCEPLD